MATAWRWKPKLMNITLTTKYLALTLQMLVENAVKHNMIMKNSPLKILIMTTNSSKLIVSNNLQRKDKIVSSQIRWDWPILSKNTAS